LNGDSNGTERFGIMSTEKFPVLILTGPTAVGKTALGMVLAAQLETEIIGADSMQIYRYMDIGTGKPTLQERSYIRHHLVDFVHPSEPYSVGKYRKEAMDVIEKMHTEGKVPLVVGGTGLYIRALTLGLFEGPDADPDIRNYFKEITERDGRNALYEQLKKVDPEAAKRIHPNDERRLIRALEVHRITGKPISQLQQEQKDRLEARYRFIFFGLRLSRNKLYGIIEKRVDRMIEMGLLDEVRSLLSMGVPADSVAMQGLGYKQIVPVIQRKQELKQAVEQVKKETRHFAKRQMTWFNGEERIEWLDLNAFRTREAAVRKLIDLAGERLQEKSPV
jgi:tRNA dimethylallyltransferase